MPESTTILGALKVTGKTAGGLSVGVLQSFTQKETAVVAVAGSARASRWSSPSPATRSRACTRTGARATPASAAMLTSTHRFTDDPALALAADPGVHRPASTSRATSRTAACVLAGERRPEPRQRRSPPPCWRCRRTPCTTTSGPTREHLALDPSATLALGPRRRAALRHVGQGAAAARRPASTGTRPASSSTTSATCARPTSPRTSCVARLVGAVAEGRPARVLVRAVAPGRVGLRRARRCARDERARGLGAVPEQVAAPRRASATRTWSTRACCAAGPRCAGTTTSRRSLGASSDPSRRASLSLARRARLGPRRRLALGEPRGLASACGSRTASRSPAGRSYERLLDNLQYVATADAGGEPPLRARPDRPGHLELHAPRQPGAHARADRCSTTAAPSSAPAATRASSRRPTRWRRPTRTASSSTAPTRSPTASRTTATS